MSSLALTLESDEQILEAYKCGNANAATTAFVRKHQRFVMSVAYRQLLSMDDARDASQEVFLRAIKGLSKFKGDSSLQTWLYRITINVCHNQRRKNRFLSFFAIGEAEGERDVAAVRELNPHQISEQSDFEQFFSKVLVTLPPKQRETFCLRYYDELSYEEISASLGTSIGALKANYHWAVKKIAEAIQASEFAQKDVLNND